MATPATRTMLPVHEATNCAVAASAEIIGAKWTALLVHDLSEGPRRFSQLERSCSGISPRTLAERLRALEHDGMVERHSYPESPPRGEYQLPAMGPPPLPIMTACRESAIRGFPSATNPEPWATGELPRQARERGVELRGR